jgi:hypothetical protein
LEKNFGLPLSFESDKILKSNLVTPLEDNCPNDGPLDVSENIPLYREGKA